MSVNVMGRVFWTDFDVEYTNKNGKVISVAPSTAKILMLAIGDSSDDFGENSWNSFEALKTKSGLSDRRSVIRIVHALINHGYISVMGLSAYGTNNFKVHLDKLGTLPTKRAVNGRPKKSDEIKTGDSGAKTGDSGAKTGDSIPQTGDSESPDPSFIRPKPKPAEMKIIQEKANLEVDEILRLSGLAAGKSWTKLPEIYHPYGKAFCASTGLTYTKSDLYKWMPIFDAWETKGHTPSMVIEAIAELKAEGKSGIISGPSSITWKLEAMAVRRNANAEKVVEQSSIPEIPESWKKLYERAS